MKKPKRRSLENHPSQYDKKIEMFIEELPKRIEQMRESFDKNDLQDLALQAEALKCFDEFEQLPMHSEKVNLIEEIIRTRQMDKLMHTLDELVELCVQTKLTRF